MSYLWRNFPTFVAMLALGISIASFVNTLNFQEASVRPFLIFRVDLSEDALSVRVENNGLGPAIINRIVFETDKKCIDTFDYSKYTDWLSYYRAHVSAFVIQTIGEDVRTEFYRRWYEVSRTPSGSEIGADANSGVEGIGTKFAMNAEFASDTLSAGQIIPAGTSLLVGGVKWSVKKLDNTSADSALTDAEREAFGDTLEAAVNRLKLGIDYCSISGRFCDNVLHGSLRCNVE